MMFLIFSFLTLCCFRNIGTASNLTEIRASVNSLKNEIKQLKSKSAALSSYCTLRAQGKCGPCICIDDYDTPKKYYCDCTNLNPKRDCLAFHQGGVRVDGIYEVTMNGFKNTIVFCDQTSWGGGWTVLQRRYDGSTNFYRNWKEYKEGFGNLHREFWIGNDNIHLLSVQAIYPKGSEALIQFRPYGYTSTTLYTNRYSHFHIDNEKSKYMMHVSGVTNNGYGASYFTSYNNKMDFSTKDSDNDKTSSYHCARRCYGGWWYNSCNNPYTNLNGEYNSLKKVSWAYSFSWVGPYNLEFSEMKMRRVV